MIDDNLLHENGACTYNEERTCLWKLCNICEIARTTEKKAIELGQSINELKTRVEILESQTVELRQRLDSLYDNLTAKMKGGETND